MSEMAPNRIPKNPPRPLARTSRPSEESILAKRIVDRQFHPDNREKAAFELANKMTVTAVNALIRLIEAKDDLPGQLIGINALAKTRRPEARRYLEQLYRPVISERTIVCSSRAKNSADYSWSHYEVIRFPAAKGKLAAELELIRYLGGVDKTAVYPLIKQDERVVPAKNPVDLKTFLSKPVRQFAAGDESEDRLLVHDLIRTAIIELKISEIPAESNRENYVPDCRKENR
jgi:hypothetical protein